MAVTVTQLAAATRGWNQSYVESITTASVTPAPGCVLVLLVGCVDESGNVLGNNWPATCVSSAGGPTWTAIGNSGTAIIPEGSQFRARSAGWYAIVSATVPAFTVTVDGNGSSRFGIHGYTMFRCQGQDSVPIGGFVFTEHQPGNGPHAVTLSAAPAVDDATVVLNFADEDITPSGATFGTTFGTWTETFDNTGSGQTCAANAGYRLTSTSTSVQWDDLNTGPSNYSSAQAAVVIKSITVGPPTLVVADCVHTHTADNIVLTGLPFSVANAFHAHNASTISLPTGLVDDFNRANGPLGGNWLFTAGALVVESNHATRVTAMIGQDSAVFNTDIGSPNHFVEADIGELVAYVTLTVRTSPADRGVNFYEAYVEPASTIARITKTVGGVFTILATNSSVAVTDPYHMRLEVDGSTLRLYINTVLAVTTTDVSLTTGNYAGFNIAYGDSGTVDNWQAGPLVAAGTDLTVANAAHALTSENVVLTSGTQLVVANGLHTHTAANVVLTGILFVLVVDNCTHAHITSDPFASVFSYPVAVSGRKWLDQNGQVYLLNDFSSWGMSQNLSNTEITQALGVASSRHFKSVAIAPMGVFIQNDWVRYQNKAGQNFWTGAPFVTNTAGSGFGPAWATFDWIMAEATRLHLTVNIVFFVSYGITGIRADLEAAGNTNAYNFGFALATRYSAYRNIVWHVMGDDGWSSFDTIGQRLDQVFRGITDARTPPRGLIVAEPYLGGNGLGMFISQEGTSPTGYQWLHLSANSIYDYNSNAVEIFDNIWDDISTYPVYDCEPPYIGATHYTGIRPQQFRERNYTNVIRGGIGTNYGDESWWTFGKLGLFVTGISWDQVVNQPETIQAMYCWDLLEAHCADPTWVPDSTIVNAAGLLFGDTKAAAGRGDRAMLVYFPSARTGITVNTSLMAGTGNVRLRWFDPTANTFSTIAASEAQTPVRALTYPATTHTDGSTDFILVVDEPNLVVNNSAHTVTSDNVTLTAFVGGTNLTVDNGVHAHSATTITLVANPPAVPDDAFHGHTASNVVLVTAGVVTIIVADCAHTMTSTIVPLTVGPVTLTVQNAAHTHIATTVNFASGPLPSHSTVTGDVTVIRAAPEISVVVISQFGD